MSRGLETMNKSDVKLVMLRLHTVLMILLIALATVMIAGIAIGLRPRILVTASMEPGILKNSLVLVNTAVPYEQLSEGQVIAFRAGQTEVLHRITEIAEDGSLTVEPDNGSGEAIVDKVDYVGKEILAIPFIGGWFKVMLRHMWIVIVVAVMLVIAGCLPYGKKQAT